MTAGTEPVQRAGHDVGDAKLGHERSPPAWASCWTRASVAPSQHRAVQWLQRDEVHRARPGEGMRFATAPRWASIVTVADTLVLYDRMLAIVRVLVFVTAAVAFVVFALDWLVRTRRINPFSGTARAVHRLSDPFVRPVERRVLRAGGVPSSAPWWTLAAVVILGILLITLLGFLRGQLALLFYASAAGARGLAVILVSWMIGLLQIALLVRVLASWLRLGEYRPWIRWSVVLTEWLLRPLRNIIPSIGMVDITPLVAYFVLFLLRGAVLAVL